MIRHCICEYCGQEFDYESKGGKPKRFCDIKCYERNRHKFGLAGDVITLTCRDCGETYEHSVNPHGGSPPIRCPHCQARAKRTYGLVGDTLDLECKDCGAHYQEEVTVGRTPSPRCPECRESRKKKLRAEQHKAWVKANPERVKKIQDRWYAKHGYEWIKQKEKRDPSFKRARRASARRYAQTENGKQSLRNSRTRRRRRDIWL